MSNLDEIGRARRYYDGFAASYETRRGGRWRYHALLDDLETELAAPLVTGRDLLEVGCGTGLILSRLAPLARLARGVDLSPRMLDGARARGLDVVEGSATALPFADASFDVAVAFKTLPHVPDLAATLAEMARVVRPGPGAAIVAELYNPWSLRGVLKRALPSARVGEGTEADVLCRYDDRWAVKRALPAGWRVAAARGIRTVTPSASLLETPLVGTMLEAVERAIADTTLAARFGGFVCWVLRRD